MSRSEHTARHTIRVGLGKRSYDIVAGRTMRPALVQVLETKRVGEKIVLITDAIVGALYLRDTERVLRRAGYAVTSLVIPQGESQKNLSRVGSLYTSMLKAGVDRKSTILALGGGVIGDLAGFVAATYQRGITLIQMPTTLLAQVDSSVGGKVGVNHPLGKNMIGAFYQPLFVWADADFLDTLPFREVVCGMGEIVKYGIIKDASLFKYLESHLEQILQLSRAPTDYVRLRCLEIKAEIVSKDERESGLRSVLNLGHTIGHSLEAAGSYRVLKHGEAVLLGTVAESYLAKELGLLPEEDFQRIVRLINRIPIRVNIRQFHLPRILGSLKLDKKSTDKKNRFVLPVRIGEVKTVEGISERLISSSLKFLSSARSRT
jgi:3-dehydroquinate synthase